MAAVLVVAAAFSLVVVAVAVVLVIVVSAINSHVEPRLLLDGFNASAAVCLQRQ